MMKYKIIKDYVDKHSKEYMNAGKTVEQGGEMQIISQKKFQILPCSEELKR